MADADDVAGADEEMGLAEGDAAVDQLGRAGDDEQRVAVLLELRPLMRVLGILDRQIVQVELPLDPQQQLAVGLEQADPDDMAVLARPRRRLPRSGCRRRAGRQNRRSTRRRPARGERWA